MALAYTYDSLVEAIQSYTEDEFADFEAILPDLIAKGELRCVQDLNLEPFDSTDVSKSTAVNDPLLELPAGTLVLRHLLLNGWPAERRSQSYVRNYYELTSNSRPIYFCQHSETHALLAPKPDAIYAAEQRVLLRQLGLSPANQSTVIASKFPNLLFWSCMMEAHGFHQNTEGEQPSSYAHAKGQYDEQLPRSAVEARQLMRVDYR